MVIAADAEDPLAALLADPSTTADGEPQAVTAAGRPAVAVTLAEAVDGVELVRRYIVVAVDEEQSLLIRLEAPAESWDTVVADLETAAGIE